VPLGRNANVSTPPAVLLGGLSINRRAVASWGEKLAVVRPTKADDGLDEKGTKAVNTTGPVIVGDHDPSADAGYDAQAYQHQRRRVVIRTIQPRNL
jgi:hypothetical protein